MVVLKQKYEEAAKLRDEEKVDIELLAANTDWKIKLATNVSLVGPEIISKLSQ
jgi:gas vesicle protein